jgi:hypothetical protein
VPRGRSLVILVVLATATLGACSDDSAEPTSSPGTDEVDQRLADQAVLTLDDLPPGWREEAAAEDLEAPDADECDDIRRAQTLADEGERAHSKFERGGSGVESGVAVFANQTLAEEAFELYTSGNVEGCFEASLDAALREARIGAGSDSPEALAVNIGDSAAGDYGDENVAYQLVATIRTESLTVDVYIDVDIVRVGRSVALLSYESEVDTFAPDLRVELVEAVVARLA